MVELNTQRMEDFEGIYRYLMVFVGLAFFLIFIRLWSLQVFKGSELRRLSENNCIRLLESPADRGILLDRKGNVLAHNRPSFEVYLVPEDAKANPGVMTKVGEILNMTPDEMEEKIKAQKRRAPFRPVKIKSDIDWNELALLESNRVFLPGLIVDVRPRRAYDYGDLASHLIGYLGEVDENELRQSREAPYRMGALIGKYGVEYRWEDDLRGVDGGRQIEVDALGREIRPLGVVEPFPGNNLFLTIDSDLQKTAEEAFKDKNGVLIAMDPETGRILAMVSKPSFEPFARNISPEEWKTLVENPYHPLTNKGIQGQYPAGSVFKIITAIAGLESGLITPNTPFTCTGAFPYGNRDFRCWKEGGHGTISLHRAIAESCDIYFYQVGLKVGVDLIAHYANEFGLGKLTGISLPHEKPGTVPSSSWKKKRFGVPWYSGETLSFSVGQGYLLTTPLQLLMLISGVANGGKLPLPQVVEKVEDIYGNILKEYPPVELGRANVSQKTLQIMQEALKGAVNDPHGTGSACSLKDKDVKVAGKTGTAQVIAMPEDFKRGEMNRIPLKFRDHAWFVAYAPFEDPKISVVVLVEHGGFGASVAAPIAKKVIEQYLNLNHSAPQKMAGEESDLEYAD
jgi:penicillin-binding protein 2